ncbi:MAG: M15 family metallopeptidase [Saprospiraceae bacterium]|nr:M15 family metallopeptidase [Saprospiraceae bacterium]
MDIQKFYSENKPTITAISIIVGLSLAIVLRKQLLYAAKLPYKLLTDLKNYTKIQTLNLSARPKLSQFVDDIQNILGYKVSINSAYRSVAKQATLAKTISVASKGLSTHMFGLAIDLNASKDGKTLGLKTPKAEWEKSMIPSLARKRGIRWGGDFVGTGYDPVHFDVLPKGINPITSLRDLKSKAEKQFGNSWVNNGNKLNLI